MQDYFNFSGTPVKVLIETATDLLKEWETIINDPDVGEESKNLVKAKARWSINKLPLEKLTGLLSESGNTNNAEINQRKFNQ